MKVIATQLGYFNNHRRREGEVFVIKPRKGLKVDPVTGAKSEVTLSVEDQFSSRWMEKYDAKAHAEVEPAELVEPESDEDFASAEDVI
jgi:hypothetical protein